MIRFYDLDLIFMVNYEKTLSALYLLNQWPDFDQTGRYIIGRTLKDDKIVQGHEGHITIKWGGAYVFF